jgi:hypothetical protein
MAHIRRLMNRRAAPGSGGGCRPVRYLKENRARRGRELVGEDEETSVAA